MNNTANHSEQEKRPQQQSQGQLAVSMASGTLRAHAVRLLPGDDLVPALEAVAMQCMEQSQTRSCFVMTAVGSLSQVTLRLASHQQAITAAVEVSADTTAAVITQPHENSIRTWNECLEVVSLVGTFARDAAVSTSSSSSSGVKKHLHMSVSNAKGETFGGHVMAGTIWTTLELVLGTIDGVAFDRNIDEQTGFLELQVTQTNNNMPEQQRQNNEDAYVSRG